MLEYYDTIKELKNIDNIIITKADKGDSIVLMDKDVYKKSVEEILENGPYTLLDKNPVDSISSRISKAMKGCEQVFNIKYFPMKYKVPNPIIPRIYAYPKIHKPGNKMRHIASNNNAPGEKLSKFILNELQKLNSPPSLSVKNSIELIDQLKNIELSRNEIIVSFDVESLYPSIPFNEALDIVDEWIKEELKNAPDRAEKLIELVRAVSSENYVQFNGKFYRQDDGTGMGHPLSCLIANAFMGHLELSVADNPIFPRF